MAPKEPLPSVKATLVESWSDGFSLICGKLLKVMYEVLSNAMRSPSRAFRPRGAMQSKTGGI